MWQRNNGNGVGGLCLKFPIVVEKGSLQLPKGKRTKQNKNERKKNVFHEHQGKSLV
jgi:hypothetical protein